MLKFKNATPNATPEKIVGMIQELSADEKKTMVSNIKLLEETVDECIKILRDYHPRQWGDSENDSEKDIENDSENEDVSGGALFPLYSAWATPVLICIVIILVVMLLTFLVIQIDKIHRKKCGAPDMFTKRIKPAPFTG